MPEIVCIARTGDPAPNGVGTFNRFSYRYRCGYLSDHQYFANDVFVNSNGEVAFHAFLTVGTDLHDEGIFKGAISQPLIQIVRKGDTSSDGVSTIRSVSNPALNHQGQVLFSSWVSYHDTSDDTELGTYEVFRGSGGPLTRICLDAELMVILPGGYRTRPIYDRNQYVINSSGDVAVKLTLADYTLPGFVGIHRCLDTYACTLIAERGATAPDSPLEFYGLKIEDMNTDGEVLFSIRDVWEYFCDWPIGLWIGAGGPPTTVAIQDQEAPDGSVIAAVSDATLTTGGMVAFCSHSIFSSMLNNNATSVLRRSEEEGLIQIACQGQAAPDGNGTFDRFWASRINASGQVVFWASLEGTLDGADDSRGIFLGTGRELTQIVRAGQVTPEGVGRFALDEPQPTKGESFPLSIASGGQVAFWSQLDEDGAEEGIYLGNGTDLIKVVRSGDILDGREVSRLLFSHRKDSSRQGLNDSGQVAFWVRFTDDTQGVYLYTPDLHLLTMADVPELLDADWPLDIPPGEIHKIFIDPDKDVKVCIAEKAVVVKKLTIGGGKGSATVRLDGGVVRAREGVEIEATGELTGSGNIDGNLKNKGKLVPNKIVVDGDVNNTGKISGASEEDQIQASGTMTNEGEIEGSLNVGCVFQNQPSGRILLYKGDTMRFHSTENLNRGQITVSDATLDFKQNLNNATQGGIGAKRANLHFNGGLINAGLLAAHCSSVHGSITNRKTGILSAHGEVIYDGDVNNMGCIRTDIHSKSIFRGGLSDKGHWAGSGTVCIEDAFEPTVRGAIVADGALVLGDNSKTKLVLHEERTCAVVDVRSTLTLGGRLKVVVPKGFNASAEDIFLLFRAKKMQGSFNEIELPDIDGLRLEVLCSRSRFSLLVSAQKDFL